MLRDCEADIGAGFEDAAMEAPPRIGLQGRRAHAIAYEEWLALAGERRWPSLAEARQETLRTSCALLLDLRAGREDPGLAFVGQALGGEGLALVSDVPRGSLLSCLTSHYRQVMESGAPLAFEGEMFGPGGAFIIYRGLLLPYSSDGEEIDFIQGSLGCTELAQGALAAAIMREAAADARRVTVDEKEEQRVPLPQPQLPLRL